MDCASCAGKVTSALDGTEGVTSVDARPATGTVSVEYDDGRADGDDLTRAVESAGYEVTGTSGATGPTRTPRTGWNLERLDQSPGDQDLGRCGVAGYRRRRRTGAALGLVEDPSSRRSSRQSSHSLTCSSSAQSRRLVRRFCEGILLGQERRARYRLPDERRDGERHRRVVVISPSANFYFEAATLAVLFSVAELLERYSMDQARSSLRELMDLSPDEATVRRDGEEVTVPVEDVAVGDRVARPAGREDSPRRRRPRGRERRQRGADHRRERPRRQRKSTTRCTRARSTRPASWKSRSPPRRARTPLAHRQAGRGRTGKQDRARAVRRPLRWLLHARDGRAGRPSSQSCRRWSYRGR